MVSTKTYIINPGKSVTIYGTVYFYVINDQNQSIIGVGLKNHVTNHLIYGIYFGTSDTGTEACLFYKGNDPNNMILKNNFNATLILNITII